jgi:hypothetical protein
VSDIPHGYVYMPLVQASHEVLGEQLRDVAEFFHKFRNPVPAEFAAWRLQQPSRQRPYLRDIYKRGSQSGLLMSHSAWDHAKTLIRALGDGDDLPIWAPLTLARAVLEACIRAAYLTDCAASSETRTLRSAGVELEGLAEQVKLARHIGDAPSLASAEDALSREERRCNRAGIDLKRDSRERIKAVSRGGQDVPVGVNVTAETERRITDLPYAYRFGSASAHAGVWFLSGAIGEREGSGFAPRPDPDAIVAASMVTLLSLEALAAATSRGEELSTLHSRTRQRATRVYDELYRGHPRTPRHGGT